MMGFKMTNTNRQHPLRMEVLARGKSVSGGPLWHVKVDGVMAGCVVECLGLFMTDKAYGVGISKSHASLEEAAAYLANQLVRYHF